MLVLGATNTYRMGRLVDGVGMERRDTTATVSDCGGKTLFTHRVDKGGMALGRLVQSVYRFLYSVGDMPCHLRKAPVKELISV